MAASESKRGLPPKIAAMKARKRQKLEDPEGAKPVKKISKSAPPQPKNLRLDDLTWNEVEMPDRLDDFEGFFGLEEIDDVDVVRTDEGVVSYRAAGGLAKKRAASSEPEMDDEEWTGFGDDNDDAGGIGLHGVETVTPREAIERTEEEKAAYAKERAKTAKEKAKSVKAEKKAEKKAQSAKSDKNAKPAKAEKKENAPKAQKGSQVGTAAFAGLLDEVEDEGVDITAWRSLKLADETLASLSKLKFAEPTPIQKSSIPEILAGHDVIGKASTGSGKTLAFVIPILERYLELQATRDGNKRSSKADDETRNPALALILSPTRELAYQISKHLTDLCSGLTVKPPSIATLTGGLSLLKQQRLLKTADIVIGTPGRLWEVISGGHGVLKWLKQIQFLVVDEADRLLSQGHFKELEEILNVLDRKDDVEGEEEDEEAPENVSDGERQTLVFSATFHKGLQQKLAGKAKPGGGLMDKKESMEYLLKKLNFREEKPKFVDVNPVSQMATRLKEGMVECAGTEKDLYLYALLLLNPNIRTLVFTNSISAVRRLNPFLQNLQLPVHALHSQMAQKARLRSIERFTSGEKGNNAAKSGSILLATDVAARGLDIPNVQLVIHYHLPRTADTYVHRSGRTARAGESGSSILICGPEEVAGVRRLVAKVHVSSAAAGAEPQDDAAKNGYFIRSLDIDRRVVSRLKPRANLAKQLADTNIAKEKKHSENDFLRQAAEDLGVEYDSEEFEQAPGKHGRGANRKKKEREARSLTRDDVQGLRRQLNDMLKVRVNVGVSERYLTSSGLDIDALLQQQGTGAHGEFLGSVSGIGLEN